MWETFLLVNIIQLLKINSIALQWLFDIVKQHFHSTNMSKLQRQVLQWITHEGIWGAVPLTPTPRDKTHRYLQWCTWNHCSSCFRKARTVAIIALYRESSLSVSFNMNCVPFTVVLASFRCDSSKMHSSVSKQRIPVRGFGMGQWMLLRESCE